jgi:signal transduction histidine kinase
MKIKNITIFFTVMMCILAGVTMLLFHKEINRKVDMVDYNDRFHYVIDGMDGGKAVADIQKKYGCTIIMRSNDIYKSLLMDAISSESVIFDYEKDGQLVAKIIFPGNENIYKQVKHTMLIAMFGIFGEILAVGYIVLAVIYHQYERPFHRLRYFAQNVARGNLDVPLNMEKNNYFGVFTESFDLMRTELKIAKENEYKANASKKELVAELSHDMKTPIATMKATCEVMNTSLLMKKDVDSSYYLDKLAIITKKADVMDRLINNMFHATLEELQTLKVEATEQPSTIVKDIFDEQQDYIGINVTSEIPQLLIYMDKLRFGQVVDNIVNNANKYASTKLWINYMEKGNGLLITVRDKGPGVDNDEIGLITQKYYKGSNGKQQDGAGLGLYLADFFMKQMGGTYNCYNDNGFVNELFLRKV